MQHMWPLIIFSEAPSMVRKSCKRTWLSKASNTLFAEMASYNRISDKVCLELTKRLKFSIITEELCFGFT